MKQSSKGKSTRTSSNSKPGAKPRKPSNKPTSNSRQQAPAPKPAKGGNSSGGYSGRNRRQSTLDPELFIKKADTVAQIKYESKRTFKDFPIQYELKITLEKKGYQFPTEIQDKSIEAILKDRDVLGIAQTGTGKTAAFLIPIINQMLEHRIKDEFALVLVPTRELALQVIEEFKSITKGLNLYSACFIGGTNMNKDIQTLRRSHQLVVGTPGRILDLVKRKVLPLQFFNTLILDEFDRMLDMGFKADVERVIKGMKERNQTLLFSATLDPKQQELINSILKKPITVQVSSGRSTVDSVEQDIIELEEGETKVSRLKSMLSAPEFTRVIIFEETKHGVTRLCEKLVKEGINAVPIQGDMSQNARQNSLLAFKEGRATVLIATDVAARGIDVDNVTHVINYQAPPNYDTYIHRIGRTGRNGQIGKAFTFVNNRKKD